MASNYNIKDMINYLDRYNQQQSTPQYQVTPEQMQSYLNVMNLQKQQEDLRQDDLRKLQEAREQDAKVNQVRALANTLGNIGNAPNPLPTLNLTDFRGQTIAQYNPREGSPNKEVTPYSPTNTNTELAMQDIGLREQARQRQLANAQEMAKFQEAIAVANQYNIPIGQAMGLTGKDILGFEKDRATAQAGVQKEVVSSIGDLYKQNLTNQGNLQVQELKNTGDYNTTQLKAINDFLIANTKAENDYAIAQLKEQGLNNREIANIISRKEIANINAKAQTDAAATRAAATRYAADQRAQTQPSYGPLSAGLNNYMFLSPEQQAMVTADYDAYARAVGLRGGQVPQANPQNVNTMNNYINNQDASLGW